MKLVLSGFLGENRAVHPKMLGDQAATASLNHKPGRADLRPWLQPLNVATVPAGRQTIYRMGRDVPNDATYWLSWPTVVHAVKGYEAEDATERTYYTGDGFPKFTDNVLGLAGQPYPTAWRALGVPAPTIALALVATGGSATNTEVRYYTYTFVTDKGHESAPAPVSAALTCKTDATVAITAIDSAPVGSYSINRVRIYRTQTGQAGDTEFFFLREIAIGSSSTTDDGRALGEVMPTDGWLPPPAGLTNLMAMWNGMMAGITPEGAVRYSVAFKSYAWPIAYETLPPDAKAVALGKFGQRLLVLTTAKPLLVAGSSPDSLDEQPLQFGEACIAPRGVVSFGHGVAWPCPDGLAYYGETGAKLITSGLMTRDDWRAIKPASIVAGIYEGAYLCFFTQGGIKKGFIVDPLQPDGIYFLETGYDALYFDELQDALYVLDGVNVRKWDAGAALMTATWRSKQWRTPETNFGAARVVADAYPVTVKIDAGPLAPAQVAALVARWPGVLTAPTATSVRFTKSITNRLPFRVTGGFLARDWQVEVSTSSPVQQVAVASTMKELATV